MVLEEIVLPLVKLYRDNKRILPWRDKDNAYYTWVSEIMLQQTRVEAVKPYFRRFITELPDIQSLAECPEEKLLKLWEGLGYYNRVRNMQEAAKTVKDEYNGRLPEDYQALLSLKGIGSYTAGAIASIAYGEKVPAVDGNVLRVISRITESTEDISRQSVRRKMEQQLLQIMPSDCPGDFNQVKELGLDPLYIEELPPAKHIFSHIEWRMQAYRIKVSSLKTTQDKELIFVSKEQSGKQYAIPSAFGAYAKYIKEETTR